ncbi:IS3 family transposase, partial [Enterococcus casseliflavus]|nr:IS3 family transposase [Enterococcus casseliflavus]
MGVAICMAKYPFELKLKIVKEYLS